MNKAMYCQLTATSCLRQGMAYTVELKGRDDTKHTTKASDRWVEPPGAVNWYQILLGMGRNNNCYSLQCIQMQQEDLRWNERDTINESL